MQSVLKSVDGDEPKVRPFGFVMEYNNRMYFCTSNQKDIYKQLKANPKFEICACSPKAEWIRVKGKAIFDQDIKVKTKALEVAPGVAGIYKTPDNPIFEVFYIDEAEATFCSFTSEPKTIKF